jgi:hypothetical protein
MGFFILILFALKWGIGGIIDQIKGEPFNHNFRWKP